MYFSDRLTMDAPRHTKDGFLVVRARAARTGVYDYAGSEVDPDNKHGLRDTAVVKVLRDENTVFDEAAVRSFIGKPITDDHPREAVTADNWRDHARGTVMRAMRDGEYLAFDLMLTDASAIRKVNSGKRELSNGYNADIEVGSFTAADGTACQARQTNISGNHVALVDHGRAGPSCAIRDGERFALCDANPDALNGMQKETIVPKITLDGLVVDLSDAAAVEAAIKKFQDTATEAKSALTEVQDALSTEKGKVTALEKQLGDAKAAIEPAQLDKLVADRSALVAKAKAIKSDIVTDGKTDAEIRKSIVAASLGDAAIADMDDKTIAGAFAVIARDEKADPIRSTMLDRVAPINPGNTAHIRNAVRASRYA